MDTKTHEEQQLRDDVAAILNDYSHSVAAHNMARACMKLLGLVERQRTLIADCTDPEKAGKMTGPGGVLYPVNADGMLQLIDLANRHRNQLRDAARTLNMLRANIEHTLNHTGGMARQEGDNLL